MSPKSEDETSPKGTSDDLWRTKLEILPGTDSFSLRLWRIRKRRSGLLSFSLASIEWLCNCFVCLALRSFMLLQFKFMLSTSLDDPPDQSALQLNMCALAGRTQAAFRKRLYVVGGLFVVECCCGSKVLASTKGFVTKILY